MEKDQVTFAIQASGLKGPLGRPILVVAEGLDVDPQTFVWLRSGAWHTSETHRLQVPAGPLNSHMVGLIQDVTASELYTSLLFWKGIQSEFESLP